LLTGFYDLFKWLFTRELINDTPVHHSLIIRRFKAMFGRPNMFTFGLGLANEINDIVKPF